MVDYKQLMKLVERAAQNIDRAPENETTVKIVADAVIGQLRDELGIFGGRLYRREGNQYQLMATVGQAKEVDLKLEVPLSYEPVQLVLNRRVLYMDGSDPRTDPRLEAALGAQKFAAIEVDNGNHILAFDIAPGHDRDDILVSLGILRHSINQKLRHERLGGIFEQARLIQRSILPRSAPEFGDFDLYGRSDPLELVGGDFYDFIPVSDRAMGLVVADASGHGLPAALQVRDIHVGLRMGLARDFKIVSTVERLNQIIHGSALSSRFVSMVFAELERNGILIYVNAGHPPPLLVRPDGSYRSLRAGGPVLGPIEDAAYERGVVTIRPGDLLTFFSDGIIETPCEEGGEDVMFGTTRLLEEIREHREGTAKEVVEGIFAAVEGYCGGREAQDDRTVMVIKRSETGEDPPRPGYRSADEAG